MLIHILSTGYASKDWEGGGWETDGKEKDKEKEKFNMMKTVIIAVCAAVAYLAIVIGLTVYCSIRLVKAKNLRKQRQEETTHGGCF